MRLSLSSAAALSLLLGCASPPPAACPAPPAAVISDGMVDVGGGVSLHFHCMGDGVPTVVMEAGAGGSGTVWQAVQPQIAKVTRACVYDRAGAGYSDTPPQPRAVAQITEELHTLLARAHVPGPFVLVGHSLGGFYVRLYASRFPADVAGMVLVDATTEDEDVRVLSLLPPALLAAADADTSDREGIHMAALHAAMAELRGANRSLGERPLVVLTAGQAEEPVPGVSAEINAQMAKMEKELQAALPGLSSNGAQVVAEKSHHFIQFDAPKLVIAAVEEVVQAVRTHGRIDAAKLRAL